MGLGHTLMEHYIFDDDGRLRNLGAIDYRIPTSMDLPLRMESDTIENDDGPGPYGAKGMSEGALLLRRAGRRGRGPRRDRGRDPGPAADPGASLAGAPGATIARVTWVVALADARDAVARRAARPPTSA